MKNIKEFSIALGIVIVLIAAIMLLNPTGYIISGGAGGTGFGGGTSGGKTLNIGNAVLCSNYDKDKDGYYALVQGQPSCLPLDCNDNDPKINTGVPEIAGDKIDNDCDGLVDETEPRFFTTSVSVADAKGVVQAYKATPEYKAIGDAFKQSPWIYYTSASDAVCKHYDGKGAVYAQYLLRIDYFKTLSDCQKDTSPVEVDRVYQPWNSDQDITDYTAGCQDRTYDNGATTGMKEGVSKIDSSIYITCWR